MKDKATRRNKVIKIFTRNISWLKREPPKLSSLEMRMITVIDPIINFLHGYKC